MSEGCGGVRSMSRVACEWKPARKGLTHWQLERDRVCNICCPGQKNRSEQTDGACRHLVLLWLRNWVAFAVAYTSASVSLPVSFSLSLSLVAYFGILLLHSKQPNHFKEAAPLQQFLLTSDKEHECGREGKRQQQPQPQSGSWWDEKREQQDKPLKGYQDMSSTAPRQIGKGWRKGLRARERTSWGVMPTSILHRCNSTHLTPRPCPGSRLLPGLSLQIQIETQTRAHVPQWTRVPQPASAGRERRNNNHGRGRSSQQIYKILEK